MADSVWKWVLYTLTFLAVIPILVFAWFFWGPGKDDIPETVGTVEVSTLKVFEEDDKPLEDATHVVEINYYNNKNKNGAELFEINFTSYMGNDISKKFSKGMQLYTETGIVETYSESYKADATGFIGFGGSITFHNLNFVQDIYCYDTSYEKESEEAFSISNSVGLSQNGAFVISVGDIPAKMEFRGEAMLDANLKEQSNFLWLEHYHYYKIDEMFFLYHIYQNAKSLNEGTHFLKLDVSPYFNIFLYDETSKQFTKLTADINFTFLQAKININNDGCNTKTQSLFGMIAGNDEGKYDENTETGLFWKAISNIELTENDFEIRDSSKYGKVLTIKADIKDRLNKFDDLRIKLLINADNCDGFDRYCFDSFKNSIYSIEIKASKQKNFYILGDAESLPEISTSKVEVLYA